MIYTTNTRASGSSNKKATAASLGGCNNFSILMRSRIKVVLEYARVSGLRSTEKQVKLNDRRHGKRHFLALITQPAWLRKGYSTRYLRIVTHPINPFQLFDSFFDQIIHSELNRSTQKACLEGNYLSTHSKDYLSAHSKRDDLMLIIHNRWYVHYLYIKDMKPDGKEEVNLFNCVSGQTRSQGLSSPHSKGSEGRKTASGWSRASKNWEVTKKPNGREV